MKRSDSVQIVYNGLTEKEATNNYTCDICNSIIKLSDGEMFTGYLGDKYFRCPVCEKFTMAKSPSDFQKAEDVVYPFSFYKYVNDYTPQPCTDAGVNKLIEEVFESDFVTVKMNAAEFGDTMVLAIEDGVDDKDRPLYKLYVCKNLDETSCTKE